jgi:hypothetical protein
MKNTYFLMLVEIIDHYHKNLNITINHFSNSEHINFEVVMSQCNALWDRTDNVLKGTKCLTYMDVYFFRKAMDVYFSYRADNVLKCTMCLIYMDVYFSYRLNVVPKCP